MASVKDILNIDAHAFRKLSDNQVRRYVTQLTSAANKRIKRMSQQGYKVHDRFSVAGKSRSQLGAQYLDLKKFFESKISSVSGIKKVAKQTTKSLAKKGIKLSKDVDTFKLFKAYEMLKERDKTVAEKGLKYKVLSEIAERIEKESIEDIVNDMYARVSEIYESGVVESDNSGFSDFFKL